MKIVIDQHGVVVVDGGNGIEQRSHEIGFCVPDTGSVFPNTVHDLLNVRGGYFLKPLLDESRGIFLIPPDLDGGTSVHVKLQHDFHKLVKLHTVILLADTVVLDLFFDFCSFIKSVRQSVRRRRGRKE